MGAVIDLQDVHKIYSAGDVRVHALRGVSFQVRSGEFVALIGASGSGKSTLLNLLGCLDRPTAGTYRFDGQDVGRLSKAERARLRNRKLGFVFQGFNLLTRHTALENVALPMVYGGVPARQRHERRWNCSPGSVWPAAPVIDPASSPGASSSRVAIARALANRPQVLLADEPTGNLDSKTGADILAEFRRLNAEHGQTIILVTHDPALAAWAPRLVTVKDGVVASDVGEQAARLRLSSCRDRPPPPACQRLSRQVIPGLPFHRRADAAALATSLLTSQPASPAGRGGRGRRKFAARTGARPASQSG